VRRLQAPDHDPPAEPAARREQPARTGTFPAARSSRNALPVPDASSRGAHGGARAVEREAADAAESSAAAAAAVLAARLDRTTKDLTGQYRVR